MTYFESVWFMVKFVGSITLWCGLMFGLVGLLIFLIDKYDFPGFLWFLAGVFTFVIFFPWNIFG